MDNIVKNPTVSQYSDVYLEFIKQIKDFINDYKKVDYDIVKKNIRRIRKECDLKKRLIASTAGISEGVYINLESIAYRYKPTIEMILKLAYAFKCDLREFIKPIE